MSKPPATRRPGGQRRLRKALAQANAQKAGAEAAKPQQAQAGPEQEQLRVAVGRVRARVAVPKYEPVEESNVTEKPAPDEARKGTRDVWFTSNMSGKTVIWDRNGLPTGSVLQGPAIVEQLDSTIVVPDGWKAHVDGFMNLILTREI